MYIYIAENERHLYALYKEEEVKQGTREREGVSANDGLGEEIESEDEDEEGNYEEDEEEEATEQNEEKGGEIEIDEHEYEGVQTRMETASEASVPNAKVNEGEVVGMDSEMQGGEAYREQRDHEMEGRLSLEMRDNWPSWLRGAVATLEGGERGKEMKPILEKFVGMERALGFKGEKTVSQNSSRNE